MSPDKMSIKSPHDVKSGLDDAEWARRRRANVRLGLLFGGIALLIFLASLWKYRPL